MSRFLSATAVIVAFAYGFGWVLLTPSLGVSCQGEMLTASWYGEAHHGRKTATGERFDMHALTAAHRTMRFGRVVKVSRAGKTVTVRITDRGPAKWTGRSLDLSREAAEKLGMLRRGVARVCVEKLG